MKAFYLQAMVRVGILAGVVAAGSAELWAQAPAGPQPTSPAQENPAKKKPTSPHRTHIYFVAFLSASCASTSSFSSTSRIRGVSSMTRSRTNILE